jgi:hypothetical protein
MNEAVGVTTHFEHLVEATGRPALIAVAALGLAFVIGSIVIPKIGHRNR